MNNLVSVIIPVKNGSNYINQAINSIKKQNANVEIIVVDDASTDNTIQIAEEQGWHIKRHATSKGQVAGKNTGIEAAKGEYVIFLDHDDLMQEHALESLIFEFIKDPSLDVVQAQVQNFISEDTLNQQQNISLEPFFGIPTGCMLFRKSVFDKIGMIDENITTGEMIFFKEKFEQNDIKLKKIELVTCKRRIHNSNYGKTAQKREYQDYAYMIREKLRNRSNL